MGGLFFSQPPFPFQVWPDLSETKIFLGAFASTYPLMLLSSPSEFLLACSSSSPWNLLFFTVESIFSSLCSRSDRPLFRQGAAVAYLDSLPPYDLVLWTDGFVPFHFGKGGSGVLANCFLFGIEATFLFSRSSMLNFIR